MRGVANIYKHPFYNPDSLNNDISLLRFSHSVYFTTQLSPVCVSLGGTYDTGTRNAWAIGYDKNNKYISTIYKIKYLFPNINIIYKYIKKQIKIKI